MDWYEAFPELTLVMGNRIPARQLRKLGMEPTIYMRPIEELFGMPLGWEVVDQIGSMTCCTTRRDRRRH